MASQSFTFTMRPKDTNSDTDSDGDGVTTVLGRGAQDDLNSDDEGDDDDDTARKAAGALPDVAVPIGLIADLSLSNGRGSTNKNDDDEDLVSFQDCLAFVVTDVLCPKGYANESYFKKGEFWCLRSHHFPGFLVCGLLIPSPSSGAATDLGLRASLIEQHTPPEILVHGLVTQRM